MPYTVTDITELIRHHLALSEVNDDRADLNLYQLARNIDQMFSRPSEPHDGAVCEGCGASVSSELIGPDGAGETADGGFNCSSCRFGEED